MIALAVAVAVLAIGCGGDDNGTATSTEAPLVSLDGLVTNHSSKDLGTATKVSIELDDLYFAPTFIKAAPGAAVEISLKNNGTVKHTFTIDQTNTNVELEKGQKSTVTITLPASGALAFYCSIHRGSGMQGAFSVSASAAAASGS